MKNQYKRGGLVKKEGVFEGGRGDTPMHTMFGDIPGNKSNIYERDWSKFDRENFILDYFSVEWEDLLKTDELNADNSTKKSLD